MSIIRTLVTTKLSTHSPAAIAHAAHFDIETTVAMLEFIMRGINVPAYAEHEPLKDQDEARILTEIARRLASLSDLEDEDLQEKDIFLSPEASDKWDAICAELIAPERLSFA